MNLLTFFSENNIIVIVSVFFFVVLLKIKGLMNEKNQNLNYLMKGTRLINYFICYDVSILFISFSSKKLKLSKE